MGCSLPAVARWAPMQHPRTWTSSATPPPIISKSKQRHTHRRATVIEHKGTSFIRTGLSQAHTRPCACERVHCWRSTLFMVKCYRLTSVTHPGIGANCAKSISFGSMHMLALPAIRRSVAHATAHPRHCRRHRRCPAAHASSCCALCAAPWPLGADASALRNTIGKPFGYQLNGVHLQHAAPAAGLLRESQKRKRWRGAGQ